MNSSISPDQRRNWFFAGREVVKFCEAASRWWSSKDGTEWKRVDETNIPEAVRSYAAQAQRDLVFLVVSAAHQPTPLVDRGWVDGVSSKLVAKVRIAS